jgi:hypothetical protein
LAVVKNETQGEPSLMAYTHEQQIILEAMGIRLYVPIPGLHAEPLEQHKNHAAFWQTRLGQNIQGLVQGQDLSTLPITTPEQGKLAKRIVWQQIRALLKSA